MALADKLLIPVLRRRSPPLKRNFVAPGQILQPPGQCVTAGSSICRRDSCEIASNPDPAQLSPDSLI